MKRKMTISLVLTLSVMLSLMSLPRTAQGQQGMRFSSRSGVLTPGMGQVVRVTVSGMSGNDTVTFRIGWTQYMAAGCNSQGVCRHTLAAQGATAPVTLNNEEAASFDVDGTGQGVDLTVWTNRRDARVVIQILDRATWNVVAVIHPFGDF